MAQDAIKLFKDPKEQELTLGGVCKDIKVTMKPPKQAPEPSDVIYENIAKNKGKCSCCCYGCGNFWWYALMVVGVVLLVAILSLVIIYIRSMELGHQ